MYAQTICLDAVDQPLNHVFNKLQTKHEVNFSYSDDFLENCFITDTSTCGSIEEIIEKLTKECDLLYKFYDHTFVIYPKPKPQGQKYYFSGKVVDYHTKEPLPFSRIQIHTHRFVTDENGFFAYQTYEDQIPFQVSYVGFQKLDTILTHNTAHVIALNEKIYEIDEVVIHVKKRADTTVFHPKPQPSSNHYHAGLIKLNHKISSFLPGNNSNTLFNLLRLQSGLLAAGEQTNDYLIWGSYKGQTQLIYDDITLFSIGSYNDHIGAVNPLMIQDIEVYKAGYGVNVGDRIGGVVNVTGKNGNREKTEVSLQLNQLVGSGRLNVPIQKNIVLQGAFRYSYNLVNHRPLVNRKKQGFNTFDTENHFRDYNLKVNWHQKNGDYIQISTINSMDTQLHTIQGRENKKQFRVAYENSQNSKRLQKGTSVSYTKKWNKKGVTKFSIASSSLSTSVIDSSNVEFLNLTKQVREFSYFGINEIKEHSVKVKHLFHTVQGHQVNIESGLIYNQALVKLEGKQSNFNNQKLTRFYSLMNDNISLSEKFRVELGCRLDASNTFQKIYIQPRAQLFYYPTTKTTINLSTGWYNQFITENYIFTPEGNNYYQWHVANDQEFSVLNSLHNVFGVAYQFKKYLLKSELYHKQTYGFSHLSYHKIKDQLTVFQGEIRAYGLDVSLEKQFKKADLSIGYNLSRVEENIYEVTNGYVLSPQNQLHEAKFASIINLHPFYLSANYIYGSGFNGVLSLQGANATYHRCDVGFLYTQKLKKMTLETGVSIINLFNANNIRYSEYQKLETDRVYFSKGTPFTPILFFNLLY